MNKLFYTKPTITLSGNTSGLLTGGTATNQLTIGGKNSIVVLSYGNDLTNPVSNYQNPYTVTVNTKGDNYYTAGAKDQEDNTYILATLKWTVSIGTASFNSITNLTTGGFNLNLNLSNVDALSNISPSGGTGSVADSRVVYSDLTANKQYTYSVDAYNGTTKINTISGTQWTPPSITSVASDATSYQLASGSSTATVKITVSGLFDSVKLYSDSGFATLLDTVTSSSTLSLTKGDYTIYAVPYDKSSSSPWYNTALYMASTTFSVTAGSIKPDGGPTPTVTNGWNIMYITSDNIGSYNTLTFSGAFNYQIIIVGAGGDGNSYKDGDVNNRQGGGGGGAGGVYTCKYTSSAGEKLWVRVQTGFYVEVYVYKVDNTPLGTASASFGSPGTPYTDSAWGDGGYSGASSSQKVVAGTDGKYRFEPGPPSCFTSARAYGIENGGNGLPNNFGSQGGGGGGGGAFIPGYNAGKYSGGNGNGNQGGSGGDGVIWSVDGVEYARGGPGGFINGAGTLGLSVSTTAGSGGSGGSGGPSGIIRETTGQGYLFAIAWQ
jgi:hypothetical protein